MRTTYFSYVEKQEIVFAWTKVWNKISNSYSHKYLFNISISIVSREREVMVQGRIYIKIICIKVVCNLEALEHFLIEKTYKSYITIIIIIMFE